jgi:hypothetical protein
MHSTAERQRRRRAFVRFSNEQKQGLCTPQSSYRGCYEAYEEQLSLGDLATKPTRGCFAPRHELNCQSFAQSKLLGLFRSRLIPSAANIYHCPVPSVLKLHPCEFTTASASAASAKEPTTRHTDPLSHTDTRWTRWPSYD